MIQIFSGSVKFGKDEKPWVILLFNLTHFVFISKWSTNRASLIAKVGIIYESILAEAELVMHWAD